MKPGSYKTEKKIDSSCESSCTKRSWPGCSFILTFTPGWLLSIVAPWNVLQLCTGWWLCTDRMHWAVHHTWFCMKKWISQLSNVIGVVSMLLVLCFCCCYCCCLVLSSIHLVYSSVHYLKSCSLRRPTWPWSGKTSVFFPHVDIALYLWWWLGFLQHVNIISSLSYHAVRSTVHAAGLRVWRGDGSDEILSRLWFNIWVLVLSVKLRTFSNWRLSTADVYHPRQRGI